MNLFCLILHACLCCFSRNGCKDIVIWLVNEGYCDPNVRDNDGETPLHFACR